MNKPAEQLQRSVFKWVQAADDEAQRSAIKPKKMGSTITSMEVAKNYGVPEEKLRSYIRHEIEEEASCRALPFTLMMFMSYTAVVLGHDPVVPINDVEDSITFDIEENANFAFTNPFVGHKGFFDINSIADWWSWMNQGFVPLAFIQERTFAEGRDLDDPEIVAKAETFPRVKRAYWLNYNKVIGGIRVRQERGRDQTCESLDILHKFYGRSCSGGRGGSGYELFPEKSTAKYTTDPKKEFWLWANEDLSVLMNILKQKEKEGWADSATSKIEITIPIFNGNLGVYSIVYVDFFMSRGGHIWKRILPLSTYSQWWQNPANIIPDIIWMIGLLYIFLSEVFNVCQTLTAKTGGGIRGIYYEYLSFWNVVDWTTVIGGFWIIGGFAVRFQNSENINFELSSLAQFDEVGQQEAFRTQSKIVLEALATEVLSDTNFRVILGFYPLLIVMRLFEAFAHQPRLSIVTSTLGAAMVDLSHFLLVFLSIFMTYVIAGVVLFGREVDNFTNLLRASITCFQIMMGDFEWDEMLLVGRFEAGFWFASFIVIIVLLMLNMLLAIVMDAYSEQKAALGEAETLGEEIKQTFVRWKGQRSGELRSLKEVSRAVRTIKDGQTFVKVSTGPSQAPNAFEDNNPKGGEVESASPRGRSSIAKAKFLFKSSSSSTSFFQQHEEFCLVTVASLVDACPKMREEQALELIEKAVNDYYLSASNGDINFEEMCHVIRKVNFSTKRLKRHMKNSLLELEMEKEKEKLEAEKAEKIRSGKDVGDADEAVVVADRRSEWDKHEEIGVSFAEMLADVRHKLRLARDWMSNEELRSVDLTKARTPMELKPLTNFDDAVQFTVKRVLGDERTVKDACRTAGISHEKDYLRRKAIGKPVRIMAKDPTDKTVKVRVPGVGDLWFALGALSQLQPIEVKKKKREDTHDSGKAASSDASSDAGNHNEEVLRRISELDAEKRIGQQTVTEAINAVSELKYQQVKEKTDRAKLHQKILGLRKKLVSRAREHRRLSQEAQRQEERLKILTQSRDEYMELVESLVEEQRKLQEKCGIAPTLALEDKPVMASPMALQIHDVDRAQERDAALEAIRLEQAKAPRERDRDSAPRHRDGDRDRQRKSSGGRRRRSRSDAGSDRNASPNASERGHDRRPRDANRGERDQRQAPRR